MKEVSLQFNNEKVKYCSICGEVLDIDTWGKSYCKTCRAEYNKTYYTDKVAGKRFVYILLGQDNRCLYVGSTKGKYRVIYHLKGLTHLELQEQDWEQLGLNKLVYADVTEIARNDLERCYIERLYIDLYKPLLNNSRPDTEELDIEKMEVLEDIVYNEYIDIVEVPIKKITLQDGKVTYNYSDLVLM